MNAKNEKRIRKVADAVRDAVAEGQTEAMTAFLRSACDFPFVWRFRMAWGILTRRYAIKKT
jgi:hypothetical protein